MREKERKKKKVEERILQVEFGIFTMKEKGGLSQYEITLDKPVGATSEMFISNFLFCLRHKFA